MRKKIIVLGDSHSRVFNGLTIQGKRDSFIFEVIQVDGATASGLKNPNSKTHAYQIYHSALSQKTYDYVLMMLGEVDAGFIIWYRYQKLGITLSESLEKTVNAYTKFILSIECEKKIIVSAPLPTIYDYANWRTEIANYRSEITANHLERTRLTLKFNNMVHLFCSVNNITYIDLDKVVLGPNGLLKGELYAADKNDHHYNLITFRKTIVENFPSAL